jgi:glycosyltransferase involved in cell wall biosynthesis
VIPNGMSEQRLAELSHLVDEPRGPRVAFIGDWSPRKGSRDWPDIAAYVARRLPEVSFAFLGTRVGAADVARVVGIDEERLDVVPFYRSQELGELLRGVRVGALPSYIEGFGLGVLEKMAAGIPSVCYDVPGPRETIGQVESRLLVPAGDTHAFAERLVELLTSDETSYRQLSQRCRAAAQRFSWHPIGRDTLAAYRERLGMLDRSAARAPRSATAGG